MGRQIFICLVFALLVSCSGFIEPTEEQIKREFLEQYPGSDIIKHKKTFEEVAVAVYEIEFKKSDGEFGKTSLMLHQCMNNDWKHDYRECGK
jgi:hypothetical protein